MTGGAFKVQSLAADVVGVRRSLLCAFVFVWGRVEIRESSEALLHTVSEKGAQLQVAERRRSGGRKHARNGGGK